ncbi:MAG TPA: MerR family transcriptional regulator, partial [Gaiellaceae bacterium]|nr:MerR family transcriptional regulator [Gaiellaceae bacterium]
ELSRRSGVSPDLLRAWERRYGLLQPARSTGGLRLYSETDLLRVRAMQKHLDSGLAAAEAAAAAIGAGAEPQAGHDFGAMREELRAALSEFDEMRAHGAFDAMVSRFSLDNLLQEIVVPYLRELGERWAHGDASVAEEHFATAMLRGRLLGLARGWGQGLGPAALLACAPGEQHDLGLIAFGLALRARGWRIVYLGADTPPASLADAAHSLRPAWVVVSAVAADALAGDLAALTGNYRIAVGGNAARHTGVPPSVLRLTGGPVAEARRLTHLELNQSAALGE